MPAEGTSAPKPEPGRVIEPNLKQVASLEELAKEGFRMFSLGPIYVYGGVQDDLVAAFASEPDPGRPRDVMATTARFERPVLDRCKEWGFITSIMDEINYDWFKKWMMAFQLIDRQRGNFWVIRHYSAPILDPIMLDGGKGLKATSLDVFALSGMQGQLIPVHNLKKYEDAPEIVRFTVQPADPEVVRLGSIALEVVDGS